MPRRLTTEQFLERAREIHGGKYDYSEAIYKTAKEKILIKCNKVSKDGVTHGPFLQLPNSHTSGNGCSKCAGNNHKTLDKFIEDAKLVHGDKYDYTNAVYVNDRTKLAIICNAIDKNGVPHGIFKQTPNSHLINKQKCPKCTGNYRKTQSEFIEDAKLVHGDKYNYSDVIYIGVDVKVIINCTAVNRYNIPHGPFRQTPYKHISGSNCPSCVKEATASKGASIITNILTKYSMKFKIEARFEDCKNILMLPFDFHLTDLDSLIEFDGEQHFKATAVWGGERKLQKIFANDLIKDKWCKDTKRPLLRLHYKDQNNIDNILSTFLNMLQNNVENCIGNIYCSVSYGDLIYSRGYILIE